jgi:nucleoid-associated protein YgaU
MKLRLLLPLLALPAFTATGLAQNTESAVQLRRDFTTVQQQRDALSEQVAQLQQQIEKLQAEREAIKAEQAAMSEKVAAADTRAVEATEALRAQKEAEMTVDMTVRAYAIKEQEALDAAKAAAIAADKQAAAERERESAVAEALRLTAERDAAKQSEAAAIAAKAAMQNELYAAQIRIENLARALAARSSVPYTPPTALRPTPVATEEPAATVATNADAAQPQAAAAPAAPRTHTVAEGESLSLIAFKYYQSPNKWDKIVAANRTKLKNPDMLRPGMVLIIP